MNKGEFLNAMKLLGNSYGKSFTEEEVSTWYSFFKEYDSRAFSKAIVNLVKENKYMPSISEILKEIKKISNPNLQLDAEEEWSKVIGVVRKMGYYKQKEALESLEPFTANIVKQIGYNRLCTSENIVWERKLFMEMFDNYQGTEYEEPQKYLPISEILKLRDSRMLSEQNEK